MNRAEAIELAKEQQEIFGGKMGEFLKFVEKELTQTTGDDLISRQAAIALAKDICVPCKDGTTYRHRCIDPQSLMELPSAERRGKWEFIGGYGYQYRCSVCITCAEHKTHYCPNCGARMESDR